ncbi:MAG: isoleucine--tRNA ligase [Candidatus Aenigmarchaeota archaeon]|nr:isoleucine--tRNA ligase [Candidatus Aenigmarchaeota archaeon]
MNTKEIEEQIFQFWTRNKIYEKVKTLRKNAKKFYFLDGPPYATGSIHMGTAMNKIIKDFYIRFFRMFGFNVWDQPGYDTHGVPIENKIEQKFGFKTKKDIEKFGVDKFVNECKNFATQYIDVQNKQFANLGVWMDWNNPYMTLDNDYIEGAWFTFKQAFEKGFLYKGVYSVHVCPHCETAVAYNEIEYEKVTDPSIYVKFQIKNKPNEYLLIMTTTPWTIPSNMGIMAKPNAEYVKVKVNNEILVVAKDLLETLMSKFNITNYKVIDSLKGKQLEGIEYNHPLSDLLPFHKVLKNIHRVVLSDQYVSLEEGTGLVHTAPGHGKEDYEVGMKNNLPAISPLKLDGTFDENSGKYAGMYAKDADKIIIEDLRNRNALLFEEKVTHDYPLCWRCNYPLLQMAVPQWFFKVTQIRDKLLKENEKINWVPSWAGQRFKNWLESLSDWPISRQRYWGIPLPIWICDACQNVKVIGSRDELPKIPKDFHKPYIDEVQWTCKKCGKGTMKRVPDVLDVWFDSGVAPWASLGYPRNKTLFTKMWPADFILEGPDQIRGWWNSLMITSIITFNRRSFDNVLFHGFVLDSHGIKMSKSKGNAVEPEKLIEKHGRDVSRFYFLSGAPWEDYYFKWEDLDEVAKSFVIIRNTFNFIKTYVTNAGKPKNLKLEDRWLLSKLNSLVANCTDYCKTFNSQKAASEISSFILNDFSRWYVKLVRDRVWVTYKGKDRQSAFYTLLYTTETLLKLLAPFTPMLAEHVYQTVIKPLKKGKESIHMYDWPKGDKKFIDKKLEESMSIVKQLVEASSAARNQASLKLRWPVKEVLVFSADRKVNSAVRQLKNILLSACNSKGIKTVKKKPTGQFSSIKLPFGEVMVNKVLDKQLLEEAMVKELIRSIQDSRKRNGFDVKELINLSLKSDDKTNAVLKNYNEFLMKEVGAKKVVIGRLEGEFKDKLEFQGRQIEIMFFK